MVTRMKGQVTMSPRVAISERVKRLKEVNRAARMIEVSSERSHIATEYYKRSDGEPAILRRANAFKEVLGKIGIIIRDDELIVGSMTDRVRGAMVFPELSTRTLKEEAGTLSTRDSEPCYLTDEDRNSLLEDIKYWEGRSVEDKVRSLWQEQFGDRMDNSIEARAVIDYLASPVGRRIIDYSKVLSRGLKGVTEEARQELMKTQVKSFEDLPKRYFLKAVITACEAVISFAKRHSALAQELATKEKDPARKQELERIAEICAWVPANPARTFHEALQSFWFTQLACQIETTAGGITPGRFDQYMYPFYEKDVSQGRLTREQALELLGCLWVKFDQIARFLPLHIAQSNLSSMFQNVTIGGLTSDGKSAVNELSYLILDVEEHVRFAQPTISLRYNDKLPEDFLLRAAEVVRLGGGKPAWFNDKYALAVLPYWGVPLEHVRDWAPVGCVEMGIPGYSAQLTGIGPAWYSLAKCLELAFNSGIDPKTRKQLGPAIGNARQFKSYEELYDAFKTQVAYLTETVSLMSGCYYPIYAELAPTPFASALMNDCIEKGKDICEGGARYNSFVSMHPRDFVTTGNSLYVIKKLVYEDKAISMGELLDALAANFEGKEELQRMLINAPKYGNDIDEVDQVVSDLWKLVREEGERHRGPFGDPMSIVYHGIGTHYAFGVAIGATPDGRKAYTPTAEGSLSPAQGTDMKGPTAVLWSASKMPCMPNLSNLLNMKFHPSALKGREGLRKFMSFIKSYYDLYGYHIQFNVVDLETLLDARKNPHLYRDLVVRVAGFTAFWVDLPIVVQDEIISRTLHEL